MKRFVSIIKNKYIIAGVVFVVWMLFFDRHDVATQYDYHVQRKGLEREKAFYDREVTRMSQLLKDLNDNPEEIERLAREKYQMKRDNEDVYVILKD